MPQQHRIAVVIPDGISAYGSGVAKGIAEYARAHGRWRLFALIGQDGNIGARRQLDADAAVVWRDDCGMLPRAIPCVYVGTGCGTRSDGRVHGDNHAVGRMVADHLLERGLRHLSFVGPDLQHGRCEGFRERAVASGATYIECPAGLGLNLTLLNADWEIDLHKLGVWIEHLPKPVGLMAHNDVTARRVVAACKLADCMVPEQVAVVGVITTTSSATCAIRPSPASTAPPGRPDTSPPRCWRACSPGSRRRPNRSSSPPPAW
jgi:LacI family transcriptional regulator